MCQFLSSFSLLKFVSKRHFYEQYDMNKRKPLKIGLLICCLFLGKLSVAQEVKDDNIEKFQSTRNSPEVRGKNALTIAGGTAVMNGDLTDPLFESYFHVGYKRFLSSYVNLNVTYHKFNLAYKDLFNNGFMSFDLNLEVNFLPENSFTPFIFMGGGLNASNYFVQTDAKIQGGGGIEYLISNKIGLKLFTDYNYVFSDELDGTVFGESNDIYWRVGFGLNLYFGKHGRSSRSTKDGPTIIESNRLEIDY